MLRVGGDSARLALVSSVAALLCSTLFSSSAMAQAVCVDQATLAIAQGNATGLNSVACGPVSTNPAVGPLPATANAAETTAVGPGAFAGTIAANPTGGAGATAIGTGSFATGTNAIGIGNQGYPGSGAFSSNSIAIGNFSAAGQINGVATPGINAIAIGNSSTAADDNTIAIGNGATVATGLTNSVAIGNGATATQANQFMLGTVATTAYTLPGLPAIGATTGNTLVTVDPTGNLTSSGITITGSGSGITAPGTVTAGTLTTTTGGVTITGNTITGAGAGSSITGFNTISGNTVSAGAGGLSTTGGLNMTNTSITNLNSIGGFGGNPIGVNSALNMNNNNINNVHNLNVNNNATVGGTFTANGPAQFNNSLTVAPGQTINMGGNVVSGVAAPIAGTDAANKNYVDGQVSDALNQSKEGIAVAIAMAGITLPTGKNFAIGGNVGFYDSKQAVGFEAAARVSNEVSLTGAVGAGLNGGGDVGGRVGFVAAF